MHAHRLRSCEVPVAMRPRTTGALGDLLGQPVYYMVKVLLAVFVALFRAEPPVEAREPEPVPATRGLT